MFFLTYTGLTCPFSLEVLKDKHHAALLLVHPGHNKSEGATWSPEC